ncbi:hypothetical protein N7463_000290 [Penicillium fimorum]|uniref:Uncharacterized protein n=1 Tax=Penicillium fimorum TaxID=1882269 RepID=A0A9X0CBD0_9EURO|nr:hypothetical protein N7463_000290 [Penicillium fimorum]
MQVFDQASRRSRGSLELLWFIAPSLASIGAVLTILSIAMDPFAQQIMSFQSQSVLAKNATIFAPRAQEYPMLWVILPAAVAVLSI